MKHYKVLVIDDEFPIRKGLIKIITERIPECIVVGEAENGNDGIAKIHETNPDIIITDIFMPQTDGLNMLEKVNSRAKVIVITGFHDFTKARHAIQLNVFDMLVKPINHQKLTNTINQAIRAIKTEKLISLRLLFLEAIDNCNIPFVKTYADLIAQEVRKLNTDDIIFLREYFTNIFFSMQEIRSIILNSPDDYTDNISLKNMIEKTSDIEGLIDVFNTCVSNIIRNMKQNKLANISKHIKMAIDYIDENYKSKITLEDISLHIGLSEVYISRLFKKETGKTVLDYINEVRLSKAKQMLDTGRYKVYEVANELGFNNSHYFSTLFKKFTGLTPIEYLQNKHITH